MSNHPNDGTPPAGMTDAALRALLADIFADEEAALAEVSSQHQSVFDPIVIRDLIREAAAAGKHPAHLILGHAEADSYRLFLREEFDEPAPKDLKDSYFLGLHIVEEDTPSKLALAGEKPHDAWDAQFSPLWKEDGDLQGPADQAA